MMKQSPNPEADDQPKRLSFWEAYEAFREQQEDDSYDNREIVPLDVTL